MKRSLIIFGLVSTMALAQDPAPVDRDYGVLAGADTFSITQKKTSLKERADITHYDIQVTPQSEQFTYKVNGQVTPRRRVFGKRHEFKLTVERKNSKLSRITSVEFLGEGGSTVNLHQVKSTSLIPTGYVNSQTECNQGFHKNILGLKKPDTTFSCVTVNEAICRYFEDKKIAEELQGKLNACGDALKAFSEHQKQLKHLSKLDYKSDMAGLTKVNGKLKNVENLYETEIGAIEGIAQLYDGYADAMENCGLLKSENLFPPAAPPVETQTTDDSNNGNEQ